MTPERPSVQLVHRRASLPALLVLAMLAACAVPAASDDSDLVAPLVTPSEDLVEPLVPPGSGTITVSGERHGSYSSARGFPVQVDSVDEATITFELEPVDNESFETTSGSVTWSYSMLATETGEGCSVIEQAEGGGTFSTGPNGPYLQLGIDADFKPDSNAYTLGAIVSPETAEEGDPNTHYRVSSTICAEEMPLEEEGLDWWPYVVDGGIVSGRLTEGSTTLSGSSQETIPPLSGEGPPTIVTVSWSVRLP